MLVIDYKSRELWDSNKEVLITIPEQKLLLEHSLVSISRWESKYKKSFLSTKEKNIEETLYYIKCMNVSKKEIDDSVIESLSVKEQQLINDYINDSMTATVINKKNNKPSRDIITSEQIYCWMISMQIPFECQKWHLARLLMLIDVCNETNAPSKNKMSKNERLAQYAKINAERRAAMNSKG